MEELGRLPGIGPKSAERIAHYLIAAGKAQVLTLAELLKSVKENIHRCQNCCNLTENKTCDICRDPRRDSSLLCIVEQARDLGAMERSGRFQGHYHVLHGRLAPLDNMGPDNLTIHHLMKRVELGNIREVIMATNPNLEGDGTALYLSSLLAPTGVKITRLARGLSSGAGLEFANTQSLADALEGRRAL
ncbi:MAG: recombination protein RecR [Gemmataceae bacterium]|nr:recombination protein RecR [Gemmataceae bacterium]